MSSPQAKTSAQALSVKPHGDTKASNDAVAQATTAPGAPAKVSSMLVIEESGAEGSKPEDSTESVAPSAGHKSGGVPNAGDAKASSPPRCLSLAEGKVRVQVLKTEAAKAKAEHDSAKKRSASQSPRPDDDEDVQLHGQNLYCRGP
ncbi:hypothetical protein BBJ29_002500, partial [Phytophthora kernoviae]